MLQEMNAEIYENGHKNNNNKRYNHKKTEQKQNSNNVYIQKHHQNAIIKCVNVNSPE